MKIKNKIFLAIFMFFVGIILCSNQSHASNTNTNDYSIDIPSTYKVTITSNTLEAESTDGQNMIMIETQAKTNQYVISESYINYMKEYLAETLGSNFILIDSDLIEQNGCKGMDLKYCQIESGIYVYVNVFQFVSDNKAYTFMIMSLNQSYLTFLINLLN